MNPISHDSTVIFKPTSLPPATRKYDGSIPSSEIARMLFVLLDTLLCAEKCLIAPSA